MISSGFKKKEPKQVCLSEAKASHSYKTLAALLHSCYIRDCWSSPLRRDVSSDYRALILEEAFFYNILTNALKSRDLITDWQSIILDKNGDVSYIALKYKENKLNIVTAITVSLHNFMVLVLYGKSSGMMYNCTHNHNWFWFLHVYFCSTLLKLGQLSVVTNLRSRPVFLLGSANGCQGFQETKCIMVE